MCVYAITMVNGKVSMFRSPRALSCAGDTILGEGALSNLKALDVAARMCLGVAIVAHIYRGIA